MRTLKAQLRRLARTRIDLKSAQHKVSAPDEAGHENLLSPGVRVYRDGPVLIDREWSPIHVTSQFIENAETYHQRYFERLDFVDLVARCLTLAGIDRGRSVARAGHRLRRRQQRVRGLPPASACGDLRHRHFAAAAPPARERSSNRVMNCAGACDRSASTSIGGSSAAAVSISFLAPRSCITCSTRAPRSRTSRTA